MIRRVILVLVITFATVLAIPSNYDKSKVLGELETLLEKTKGLKSEPLEKRDSTGQSGHRVRPPAPDKPPQSDKQETRALLNELITDLEVQNKDDTLVDIYQRAKAGCDGSIPLYTTATGTITSPGFNKGRYPNYAYCEWQIRAPQGKNVELTFAVLKLEDDYGYDMCFYDYLELYEGDWAEFKAEYCGSYESNAVVATSTGRKISISFSSDDARREKGFKIKWRFVDASSGGGGVTCGGDLTGNEGSFSSPVAPGTSNYPDETTCQWNIQVDANKLAHLSFLGGFSTELGDDSCPYDYVAVYDGPTTSSTLLGKVCGVQPPEFTGSTNQLTLVFFSDGSTNDVGFVADYRGIVPTTPVPPTTTPGDSSGGGSCGGPLTGTQGSFSSPVDSGTSEYPASTTCTWNIQVTDGKRAHVRFEDGFSLEFGDSSCPYDYVEIYDGPSTSSPVLGKYCGTNIPAETTGHTKQLTVVFVSDGSQSYPGFVAHYSEKDAPTDGGGGNTGSCGMPAFPPSFNRIVGGQEARENSWPWQIQIQLFGGKWCGGSVIHPRWILTAAHCFDEMDASIYTVVVGEHDLGDTTGKEVKHDVDTIIKHANYDPVRTNNDITLLKLKTPITLKDEVSPVCMPAIDVVANMECAATGWGSTEGTADGDVLQQVMLPIVDRNTCEGWLPGDITPKMICAGYPEGQKDSCQGDSGGPLVCLAADGKYYQHGITSWGYGCADAKKPGIYTRVTQFTDWISTKTNGQVTV